MWLGAVLVRLAGSNPLFAQEGGKGVMKDIPAPSYSPRRRRRNPLPPKRQCHSCQKEIP
jgi:hypothetical protein